MTLSSDTISASQINVELGYTSNASFSINDYNPRALAGKTTDASTISFGDFHGQTFDTSATPAGNLTAPTYTTGMTWTNLSCANDNDFNSYCFIQFANSSSAIYAPFISAGVGMSKRKVSAKIRWGGYISGTGQVYISCSSDNGASWGAAVISYTSSWNTTTDILLVDVPNIVGSYKFAFYIWVYSSAGGLTSVSINEITLTTRD